MCVCYVGIIDDIYGADYVSGSTDGNVQDQNGHGTFVTGVVGAVGNNGQGVTGMNQVHSHGLMQPAYSPSSGDWTPSLS